MNKEIEIKVRLKDYNKTRALLRKKCKFLGRNIQIDEYWTPEHKNIYAGEAKEYWRIRKQGEKTSYEYHKPVYDQKGNKLYAEEYETEVENGEILDKIMRFIDAQLIIVIEKEREYYVFGDFEICLDRVKELGDFLEIEAKKVMKNYKNTLNECNRLLDELGIEHKGKAMNYFKQMIIAKGL